MFHVEHAPPVGKHGTRPAPPVGKPAAPLSVLANGGHTPRNGSHRAPNPRAFLRRKPISGKYPCKEGKVGEVETGLDRNPSV